MGKPLQEPLLGDGGGASVNSGGDVELGGGVDAQPPSSSLVRLNLSQSMFKDDMAAFEFVGWGEQSKVLLDVTTKEEEEKFVESTKHQKLGQLTATAISGNDITSSCLYVAGIVATVGAGKYAFVSLAVVALVLYLFRATYTEVCSALPLNGGAYNVLLNTTTKGIASIAACLTLISYVATSVMSANSAAHYLQGLVPAADPMWTTVVILGVFAVLNLVGIGESAVVALGIFIMHMLVLFALVVASVVFIVQDPSVFLDTWKYDKGEAATPFGAQIPLAIFWGYSSGLLGISGFESSANFIEEQKKGVFPKTLRNMWVAVAFFNPVLSFLSTGVLSQDFITNPKNNATTQLLALMAKVCGGQWFKIVVSVDAFLVLSGAVLTGYVGVTGLTRRLALDRLLPQFLLTTNKFRGTNHYIIIGFFIMCTTMFLALGGSVISLSALYTMAFLSVMALFAAGNLLLKFKRGQLKRSEKAKPLFVVIALIMTVTGVIGNAIMPKQGPDNIKYFVIYYGSAQVIMVLMFSRIRILRVLARIFSKRVRRAEARDGWSPISVRIHHFLVSVITDLNKNSVVFYTKRCNVAVMHKACQYVKNNEQTSWMRIIHCYTDEAEIPPTFLEDVAFLDRCYPKLRVDAVLVRSEFTPLCVDRLSTELEVPKNFMFIASVKRAFQQDLAAFGGVRVITGTKDIVAHEQGQGQGQETSTIEIKQD